MFEVDGVKYVPVSPSERTCDAIDCVFDSTATHFKILPTVTYRGVTLNALNLKPYICYQNKYIKDVELRTGGVIPDYAFQQCSNIESITLDDNYTLIGKYAFEKCSQLRQIIIPDSVKSIEKGTFSGCSALQQIIIPNSILSIGDSAFSWCLSLKQIIIPDSVISIGNYAFRGCDFLQRITIHNSIENIGNNPFCGCDILTLKSESSRFIIQNGLLIDNQNNKIISYLGKDNSVVIPDTVTTIASRAFDHNNRLMNITIPDGLESLENFSFYYEVMDELRHRYNYDYFTKGIGNIYNKLTKEIISLLNKKFLSYEENIINLINNIKNLNF